MHRKTRLKNLVISLALSPAVAMQLPCPVSADTESVCQDKLTECLFRPSSEIGVCFSRTATEEVCKNSHVAALTSERASLGGGSSAAVSLEEGSELPRSVNQTCLEKFDLALSARLINDDVSPETVSGLKRDLERCVAQTPPDTRP